MAHYVNKIDLLYEVILSKGRGKCSTKLSDTFYDIAKGVSHRIYYDVDIIDDQVQDAMCDMLSFYYKFDEKRYSDPFAYFTELAKRAMASSYKKFNKNVKYDKELISLDGLDYSNF